MWSSLNVTDVSWHLKKNKFDLIGQIKIIQNLFARTCHCEWYIWEFIHEHVISNGISSQTCDGDADHSKCSSIVSWWTTSSRFFRLLWWGRRRNDEIHWPITSYWFQLWTFFFTNRIPWWRFDTLLGQRADEDLLVYVRTETRDSFSRFIPTTFPKTLCMSVKIWSVTDSRS